MTFKEKLLAAPERENRTDTIKNVSSLYVIPTKRKHESGFNCMVYVACVKNEDGTDSLVRYSGDSDVLWCVGEGDRFSLSMDCVDGVIHLYDFGGDLFQVGPDRHTVKIMPQKGA